MVIFIFVNFIVLEKIDCYVINIEIFVGCILILELSERELEILYCCGFFMFLWYLIFYNIGN